VELASSYRDEAFADKNHDVWWHRFRRKTGVRAVKSKYQKISDPCTVWKGILENWRRFDKILRQCRGSGRPTIILNSDETSILHLYSSTDVIISSASKNNAGPRGYYETTAPGKEGSSLLVHQASVEWFRPPVTVLCSSKYPADSCKEGIRQKMAVSEPGSLFFAEGNVRGKKYVTKVIWGDIVRNLIAYKSRFSRDFNVIWIVDDLKAHALIGEDEYLEDELITSNIFFLKLAGGTTDVNQVLDCMGLLRTLKTQCRNRLCGSVCAIAESQFWDLFKEVRQDPKYNCLKPFARVGFSPSNSLRRSLNRANDVFSKIWKVYLEYAKSSRSGYQKHDATMAYRVDNYEQPSSDVEAEV